MAVGDQSSQSEYSRTRTNKALKAQDTHRLLILPLHIRHDNIAVYTQLWSRPEYIHYTIYIMYTL